MVLLILCMLFAVDVDECFLQTDTCHLHGLCLNANGSFSCSCSVGYTGDGHTCSKPCLPCLSLLPPSPPLPSGCMDGQTVLANGSERLSPGALEGRVELCLNNTYSPVCFDLWDDPEAMVVCRALQLGQSQFA